MPDVAAGEVIAIVLLGGSDVGPPAPRWFWGYGEATPYAGGEALETGNIPPDWIYAPDFDFTFTTYVAAGEPTCQISAWIDDEQLGEPVEIVEGTTFDIWFEDFPPFGSFAITWDHEGYDVVVDDDAADAFGDSWWYYETVPGDAGLLTITATTEDPACQASLNVTIVAAPAPTPTPTPTAAPTGSAGGITLPPTTTVGGAPSGGASVLPALLVLGATVGVLVVASRRFSPTLPDRR
jgi:hypothetical protein